MRRREQWHMDMSQPISKRHIVLTDTEFWADCKHHGRAIHFRAGDGTSRCRSCMAANQRRYYEPSNISERQARRRAIEDHQARQNEDDYWGVDGTVNS